VTEDALLRPGGARLSTHQFRTERSLSPPRCSTNSPRALRYHARRGADAQAGVIARADFCLLLDDVQDPGNVGSMLRSAAAAGIEQVLLSKHCAFAWSPKVLRAGQGAHFYVELHEDVDLAAWARDFREAGGAVVAMVATGGTDLYDTPFDAHMALAIGNEGAGISAALAAQATRRVTIPMPGGVESLNAAAAAAVCLFECVRRRRSRPPGAAAI
jgi:TrmH family RNA methyltransferase